MKMDRAPSLLPRECSTCRVGAGRDSVVSLATHLDGDERGMCGEGGEGDESGEWRVMRLVSSVDVMWMWRS